MRDVILKISFGLTRICEFRYSEWKQEKIMNWDQVLIIIGSNIALILVMFGTTVTLWLHTDKKIDAMHQTIDSIKEEMKDFHGRLCAIEERNKNK